jgi:hypothetical protein
MSYRIAATALHFNQILLTSNTAHFAPTGASICSKAWARISNLSCFLERKERLEASCSFGRFSKHATGDAAVARVEPVPKGAGQSAILVSPG